MKILLPALAVLVVTTVIGLTIEIPRQGVSTPADASTEGPVWRRTVNGWEDASRWRADVETIPWCEALSKVHPLVIVALQVLISLGALIAAEPVKTARTRKTASAT